jgi:hypothetical protein
MYICIPLSNVDSGKKDDIPFHVEHKLILFLFILYQTIIIKAYKKYLILAKKSERIKKKTA